VQQASELQELLSRCPFPTDAFDASIAVLTVSDASRPSISWRTTSTSMSSM
jgi:hypothetical protein